MKAKFMGAVYGSIIGDIIGSYNEFRFKTQARGMGLRKITKKVLHEQRSVFGYKFGYFTDDTTMSLILMDCLNVHNEVNESRMMDDLYKWYYKGYMSSSDECFDIGGQCLRSIKEYFNIPQHYRILGDQRPDGNGALMRIFPIALRFHNDKNQRIRQTVLAHDLTHKRSNLSLASCLVYNEAVAAAYNGESKESILEILKYNKTMDENISTSGYVVDTFNVVVHTFNKFDNLMDGIVYLANMGDDSDTAACIYGALAGAFYGVSQVPQWMMNSLRRKTTIKEISEKLYDRTVKMSGKRS